MSHLDIPKYRQAAREASEIERTHEILKETKHKINVFRFQRFLNETGTNVDVDGEYGDQTHSALNKLIATDTAGLQVFLNELGANIAEDGVFGSETKGALKKLLNISLDSTSHTTSSIDIKKGKEFVIPKAFLDDPVMKKQLKKLKGVGIFVNGDRAIIENPKHLEQFKQYIEYTTFIHEVERNPKNAEIQGNHNKEKLMDNYVALINEGTDWMTEELKLALSYKYAEAIYNDVVRMGCIIQRSRNADGNVGAHGEYNIISIETGEIIKDNPYSRVLRKTNTRNLIDIARVTSLVRKNFVLNEKKIVGDASLVQHMLEEHEIVNKSGTRIQQARLLLLHRDHVIPQIDKKIKAVRGGADTSAQAYQELVFLKEYVEQGEIGRVNYMKKTLLQINKFKGFLKQKALIGGDWNPDTISHATDKDITDIGSNLIRNNRGEAAILGIIAWIMGYKKGALGAFGIALFGDHIANGIHGAGKAAKGVIDEADLELVRLSEVTYTLDNSNYQTQYASLAEKNREFTEKEVDSNNQQLPFLNNELLFNITNAITGNQIDVKVGNNTNTVVSELQAALSTANENFSENDLRTYVQLLKKSGLKELNDRSVLDILSGGLDTANQAYESLPFTEDDNFNTALNRVFENRYTAADRETRQEIIADRQRVYELLTNNWQNTPAEGQGYFGTTINFLKEATIGLGNYSIDGLESANRFFNWSKQFDITRIENIASYLEANNVALKTDVVNILNSYKAYYQGRAMVEKYQGIFDSNVNSGWKILYSVIGAGGIAFNTLETNERKYKINLVTDINDEIQTLESLKTKLNSQDINKEPFKSLISDINKSIENLTQTRDEIVKEFDLATPSLSNDTVAAYFAAEDGDIITLESEIQNRIDELQGFVNGGPITASSIKKIQDSYTALIQYTTDLSEKVANHNSGVIKNIQTGILRNIEKFEENDGLRDQVQELITSQLTEKYKKHHKVSEQLKNIDTSDLEAALEALGAGEDFLQEQIDNNSIATYIQSQSSLISTSWENIKEALGTGYDWGKYGLDTGLEFGDLAVDTGQAALGTLAYATWTLDYFQGIRDKFDELLAAQTAGDNNPQVVQNIQSIQTAIRDIAQKLKELQKIDKQNKETLKEAKKLLGNISVPHSDISLEDIQRLLARQRNSLETTVIQDLSDIDASTLDTTGKTATFEKLEKIEKFFIDKPAIVQKVREVREGIFFTQTLAEINDWHQTVDQDIRTLTTKISNSSLSANEKNNLQNIEKLLKILSGSIVTDYTVNGQDYTHLYGNNSISIAEFATAILQVVVLPDDQKRDFLATNIPKINKKLDPQATN